MTKIENKVVKCFKCGKTSEQEVIYSVNFAIGSKEENEKLLKQKQICPYCGYKAIDISVDNEKDKQ